MTGSAAGQVGSRIVDGGPWEEAFGYSRAVVLPGPGAARVLVSGCTATVEGRVLHPDDAYRQAQVALDVVERALVEAGSSLDQVVRSRMYVVGRQNCDPVGRAHGERLAVARPAATMVLVAGLLVETMLVEIEVEAVLPA